ncbi:hypothetical protein RFI_19400 [Reticulomyxa filosa]|uniref:CLASP N-terminal domain-containing protein n=1 Tax=Reticulomyxa filosa TaxID=46433 RepID=X6MVR3_RETFI|nr:hypothetical protein RFI_19400 [Reticulomyxa filosa]|eukprot:ETO17909.1 hypothetical protein RFI_19400 [Reticulomyxa filosa]
MHLIKSKLCVNLLQQAKADDWNLRKFLMEMIGCKVCFYVYVVCVCFALWVFCFVVNYCFFLNFVRVFFLRDQKTIEGLVEESKDIDENQLWEMRTIVKNQLTDLRSQIVKCACTMLSSIAKNIGVKYTQMFSFLIPVHLKGLYVKVAIISDSHKQALKECVGHFGITNQTNFFKKKQQLLQECQDKHKEVRVEVIKMITKIIAHESNCNRSTDKNCVVDCSKLRKYQQKIQELILDSYEDGNLQVRNATEQLYQTFQQCFPQELDKLFFKLSC